MGRLYPCLRDSGKAGGVGNGQYFHQDLLVARRIYERDPKVHCDVGSRVDGFVAHVASFREIVIFDLRSLPFQIQNVECKQADFMRPLGGEFEGYCDSLSCLHALEHFGLGRYGDEVSPDGHLVGLANLQKMLKANGTLYLSVPIGPQRIEFNAHRVFDVETVLNYLEQGFKVERVSYIDDDGILHDDVEFEPGQVQGSFGCWFGCGVFEARRR